jgi:hypothetical protein
MHAQSQIFSLGGKKIIKFFWGEREKFNFFNINIFFNFKSKNINTYKDIFEKSSN